MHQSAASRGQSVSACRPYSRRSAVGHVQNAAKKGRRVDTPVAKEHGNVPSRSWQAVGLALFPVLGGPEEADKMG